MIVGPDLDTLLAGLLPWVAAMAFALARTGGFILGLPHMSVPGLPRHVQAIAAIAIAWGLVSRDPDGVVMPTSEVAFVVGLIGEFGLGLAFGFVVQLALAAARIAGEFAGVEMGMSFAAVTDPLSPEEATAVSLLLTQIGVQIFFAADFDRLALRTLAASLHTRPLGEGVFPLAGAPTILASLDGLIRDGITLALPVLAAVFCLKLAMAMLARIAPKLQIFNLSFPVTILAGLLVLNASLPATFSALHEQQRTWMDLLQAWVAAPR